MRRTRRTCRPYSTPALACERLGFPDAPPPPPRRRARRVRAPRRRSARSRLRSAGAAVDVDARTGAVRFIAGRAAPLSAAAAGDRRDLAERYLRGHLAALGLARGDLGSLRLERRAGTPGGALLLG